jgi:predicted RNA-binding protein YlxR (DUF448 family)
MPRMKKIPQRMCLGCRQMKNKKELIRVVRTPEREIILDKTGKKPGRGAYICPNLDCFSKAVKGNRLQQALKHQIPEGVVEELRRELVED